jgi:hypothetical protein
MVNGSSLGVVKVAIKRQSMVPGLTLPVSNFGVGINDKGVSTYKGVLLDILPAIGSSSSFFLP